MNQPTPAPATPTAPTTNGAINELDMREVPKPQRHPLVFARFDALAVGDSFTLVNGHDPQHLHQEFERDHPGAYAWEYLDTRPVWRIRISRLVEADLLRVVGDTNDIAKSRVDEVSGAAWKLATRQRHLDANVIDLAPGARIPIHRGPDLDVLLHIVAGAGTLITEASTLALNPGALVWLPRRSLRSITAGSVGLSYLSVHPRRPALSIDRPRER